MGSSSRGVVSMPAPAVLDGGLWPANLGQRTRSPGEMDVLSELSAVTGFTGTVTGTGVEAPIPLTAEAVGQMVGAAVTAVLRERFVADRPDPPELGDLAAQLDIAVIRAWRDLDDHANSPAAHPAGLSILNDAQLCTMLAVDIAEFTRSDRDDEILRFLHEQLYVMLPKAFDASGVPWAECWHEDRGDGMLIVLPPGISGLNLAGRLPGLLGGLIRRQNHACHAAARIQLRVAAHFGLVAYDGHGFVGDDVNQLFRILDAPPLKRALAASGADLALIVSDQIYRSFVCHYRSLVRPDAFEAVTFEVKATEFHAWRHLQTSGLSAAVRERGPGPDAGGRGRCCVRPRTLALRGRPPVGGTNRAAGPPRSRRTPQGGDMGPCRPARDHRPPRRTHPGGEAGFLRLCPQCSSARGGQSSAKANANANACAKVARRTSRPTLPASKASRAAGPPGDVYEVSASRRDRNRRSASVPASSSASRYAIAASAERPIRRSRSARVAGSR
jgi:hypothetical protein